MTEKNNFAYTLFLSLNISNFNVFYVKIATPPEKSRPPLSQQPSSKSWGPVKPPPFLKIWLEAQRSPCRKGQGAQYENQHVYPNKMGEKKTLYPP